MDCASGIWSCLLVRGELQRTNGERGGCDGGAEWKPAGRRGDKGGD